MGMMARRNVKARAVENTAPVVEKKVVEIAKKTEEVKEETLSDKVKAAGYIKADFAKMTTAKIQEVAKGLGVEDAEEKSGNQLRKLLSAALSGE